MNVFQEHCRVCEKILHELRKAHDGHQGIISLGTGYEVLQEQKCEDHKSLILSALGLGLAASPARISEIKSSTNEICVYKNKHNAGTLILIRQYMASPIPSHPLSALYVVRASDDWYDYISGSIIHPYWIDSSLPRRWKEMCLRRHGRGCANIPSKALSETRPALLIDVQQQCIVHAPEDASFVALSYVWGDQKCLQASRDNINHLSQPGTLANQPLLAKTIRDAIKLTKLLNEKYLWADALCIVQDDENQKHAELNNMAAIYATATLTIIAADSENANSGLKGLWSRRNLTQFVHNFRGLQIVQTKIGNDMEIQPERNIWDKRGWTYQEGLFSRRKLIFSGNSVRWECANAVWREHVDHSTRQIRPRPNFTTLRDSILRFSLPNLQELAWILSQYNKREFSFPEDALSGFAGISTALGYNFVNGFVSGLPSALFGVSILWQPKKNNLARRIARKPEATHCLPSWSWAGWLGEVSMDDCTTDFARSDHKLFRVFPKRVTWTLPWRCHRTGNSKGTPIRASILDCKEAFLQGRLTLVGWTSHRVLSHSESKYEPLDPRQVPIHYFEHSRYPDCSLWYPIPIPHPGDNVGGILAPFISARTQRTHLQVCIDSSGRVSLRDNLGRWVGAMVPTADLEIKEVELAEVAGGFCREKDEASTGLYEMGHDERPVVGEWYEYYWVMWVEWKDGIAYRKGLGRACKQIWDEQTKEDINLFLG